MQSRLLVLIIVGVGLLLAAQASDSEPGKSTIQHLDFVGRFGVPADHVAVKGSYLYVTEGWALEDKISYLRVVDVSDPTRPDEVGELRLDNGTYNIDIQGNYAYLAMGDYGLGVVDISNPAAPKMVGIEDPSGYAGDVFVSGRYAYVAYGLDGLRIMDISDPRFPEQVAQHSFQNDRSPVSVESVFVEDDRAFLGTFSYGLYVLDISNPVDPRYVGQTSSPQDVEDMFVVDGYAYTVAEFEGLVVIDATNPANPRKVIPKEKVGFGAIGIDIVGSYAFLSTVSPGRLMTGGLQVLDISNPTKPSMVLRYETGGSNDVQVADGYAYVAEGREGVYILRLD
ncbi:MAG: hypothetical protein WD231_01180 [Candidatus Woykebacteria bacterium]